MILQKINLSTVVGKMIALADQQHLYFLDFADSKNSAQKIAKLQSLLKCEIESGGSNKILAQLESELAEYFKGLRKNFTIPLKTIGTDFQKQVWQILQKTSYGETISYKEQATKLGKKSAVRAVANANGKNNISILIPCHRIINSSGKLGGYAGGLERKKYLLAYEQKFT